VAIVATGETRQLEPGQLQLALECSAPTRHDACILVGPRHHDESLVVVTANATANTNTTHCSSQQYHDCESGLVVRAALQHHFTTAPIVSCARTGRICAIQCHGTGVGFVLGCQCQSTTPRGSRARSVQLDQFLGPSGAVAAATFSSAFVVVVDQCDFGHGSELWWFGIGGDVDPVRTDALCRLGQCARPGGRVSNGECVFPRLEYLAWTPNTNILLRASQTMWFPVAQQRSTALASLVNNGSNHELDGLELDLECSYSFRLQPGASIRHSIRRDTPIADSIAVAILVGILLVAGCLSVRNGLLTKVNPLHALLELLSL
jgi:hypothetical protein